jgi:hypothetical protein
VSQGSRRWLGGMRSLGGPSDAPACHSPSPAPRAPSPPCRRCGLAEEHAGHAGGGGQVQRRAQRHWWAQPFSPLAALRCFAAGQLAGHLGISSLHAALPSCTLSFLPSFSLFRLAPPPLFSFQTPLSGTRQWTPTSQPATPPSSRRARRCASASCSRRASVGGVGGCVGGMACRTCLKCGCDAAAASPFSVATGPGLEC